MKSNLISSYPCVFLPDGVLNLCCIYFPPSEKGSSFLLIPASSYFWHPWYVGGFKELSSVFFYSQPVGKIFLILEVVPLPSFTPSLHKHNREKYLVTTQNKMRKLLYDYHCVLQDLNGTTCPAEDRPKTIFTPLRILIWSTSVLHWQ